MKSCSQPQILHGAGSLLQEPGTFSSPCKGLPCTVSDSINFREKWGPAQLCAPRLREITEKKGCLHLKQSATSGCFLAGGKYWHSVTQQPLIRQEQSTRSALRGVWNDFFHTIPYWSIPNGQQSLTLPERQAQKNNKRQHMQDCTGTHKHTDAHTKIHKHPVNTHSDTRSQSCLDVLRNKAAFIHLDRHSLRSWMFSRPKHTQMPGHL